MIIYNGIKMFGGVKVQPDAAPISDNDIPTVVSNAPIAAVSPFSGGGNSYSFAGATNSYVYYAGSSALAFGTGDYTVEWWQYDRGSPSFPRIFWYGSSPSLGMSQEGTAASRACYLWPGASNLGSISIPIDTWKHIAIVRISGRVYMYNDGVLRNSGGTVNTTNITDTTSNWYIGSKAGGGLSSEQFYGYITNMRVCKGLGVYTGNFTVPTSALSKTQSSGTNISAITAGQCSFLMKP